MTYSNSASTPDAPTWNGTWTLESRTNYESILRHNGVPEDRLAEACRAEDLWAYSFAADGSTFHMDHQIAATGFHVNFVAHIDGKWSDECPYQATGTTASRWKDANKASPPAAGQPLGWRNTWDPPPGEPSTSRTRFKTEVRNADGSMLRFHRHLLSPARITAEIYIVRVEETTGVESVLAGPSTCNFVKKSDELPFAGPVALRAQRKLFDSGATRSLDWRREQIVRLCDAVMAATDAISEAQAADGVVPAHFGGSAAMLAGARGYYLAMIPVWMAPQPLVDTLPAERRGGIECAWTRVHEPKGAVLNVAPWNAPVLLSILPCLGALAAGNT